MRRLGQPVGITGVTQIPGYQHMGGGGGQIEIGGGHHRTLCLQARDNGLPDAACRAGYKRLFVFKLHVELPCPPCSSYDRAAIRPQCL